MQPQQQYDYTNLGGSVSQKNVVLQKTYALLAVGFIPAIGGAFVSQFFNFMSLFGRGWMGFIAFFVMFYGLVFLIEKNRYSKVGMGLFFVLTAMLGWMIGPLLQFALSLNNGSSLVGMAAAMTAGVFFTMSMLARSSKINMNAISKFLLVGFVVLLVGVVANFFLKLPALALTISAGFVIFSSVMIMFQTKAVIDGGEDSYISAALTIFISLYNIFSSLLHILISLSGND